MKASTIFCAAIMIAVSAQIIPVSCSAGKEKRTDPTKLLMVDGRPLSWLDYSGMYFNSRHVVEEYEVDDALVIVYDDADSGLFELPIPVDPETYYGVIRAKRDGYEMEGRLILNADYECAMTFMP